MLCVDMQEYITSGDISRLRTHLKLSLFLKLEYGLKKDREAGVTHHVDNVTVQNVDLRGFAQQDETDHIIASVEAKLTDFTVKDETGEIIDGSNDEQKLVRYEWDLSRRTNNHTFTKNDNGQTRCPYCGEPILLTAKTRCEYCGREIKRADHEFVLCSIKVLSQTAL